MPSAAACVARGRTKLELAAENVKYQRRAEAAEAERDRLREMLRTLAYDLIGSGDSKQVIDWALEVLERTA